MVARTLAALAGAICLFALTLLAQQPAPEAAPATKAPAPAPATPAERIRRGLEKRVSCEFIESTLSAAMESLGVQADIPIRFDRKALADVGIGTDTPVTRNLKNLRLKSVLRLILKDLDLTCLTRDEVLLITTPEEADAHLETRIYPVQDLIEPDLVYEGERGPRYDLDKLSDMLTSSISPPSWDDVGGSGSMEGYGTSLVVSMTEEVHDQIEEILRQLRAGRELWKKWDGKTRVPTLVGGAVVPGTASEDEVRVTKALGETTEWSFVEKPLSECLDEIAARHRISIEVDKKALADVGIGTDTPVTQVVSKVSLAAGLRHMLRQLDLTLMIDNDVLLITTPEEENARLKTRVYPVFDLVKESLSRPEPMTIHMDGRGNVGVNPLRTGGGFGQDVLLVPKTGMPSVLDNTLVNDSESLIDLICSTIAPTHWDDVGGPGSIHHYANGRGLVVSATQDNHAAIEALLTKLRGTTPVPRKMSQEVLDEHERQVITHVFLLGGETPERPMPDAKEVADAIRRTVSPEIWDTPGNAVLPLRGRVRVVAPRKTVRAIDKLLHELAVFPAPPKPEPAVRVPPAAPMTPAP